MNGAQLRAWFTANRTVVLAAGGAGVVGLGLVARKKAGGDATGAGGDDSGTSYAPGFSAGAQVAGVAGTYDSSASDLYSALSPELAGISQRLEQLRGEQKPPTPVPAAPKSPAAGIKAGYYKKAGESNIYRISGGKVDYLTHKQYEAMTKGQKVTIRALSPDNPVWANGAHWLDKSKQGAAAAAGK